MFCLFVSNFKNMFKRCVQSKSLFFNRSYVVEHRRDVIKTVYVHVSRLVQTFKKFSPKEKKIKQTMFHCHLSSGSYNKFKSFDSS